jgi:Ala-tRNA(Pro) deacylase
MPPFGNLYDMAVYAGEMLTHGREIAFNAGTHNELVRLGSDDFARLAQPRVARFAAAAGRMTAWEYDR